MKVLLISQFFSTTRGGGEYVFSVIAKKYNIPTNHNDIITQVIAHFHKKPGGVMH